MVDFNKFPDGGSVRSALRAGNETSRQGVDPRDAAVSEAPHDSLLFVSDGDNLQDPEHVRELFDRLETRPIQSLEDLKRLIYDFDELLAALSSTSTDLLYRTFQDTSDEHARDEYTAQIRQVSPLVGKRSQDIRSKILDSPFKDELTDRFAFYLQHLETDRAVYCEANIPLTVEARSLANQHNSLYGEWRAVISEGTELTREGAEALLTDPHRQSREMAWRASAAANATQAEGYHEIFDRLLTCRTQIAENLGEPDFTHYHNRVAERSFTPEESAMLHVTIERIVVPALARIRAEQATALGVDTLRPWDIEVFDSHSRPPRSGLDSPEGPEKVFQLLESIDPALGTILHEMNARGDLDLLARPNKRSGGYLFTRFLDSRIRLIMNAAGGHSDVRALSHEAGHALHGERMKGQVLASYRGLDGMSEMAETASFSTELFATRHYDAIYDPTDANWAKRRELIRPLETLCWVAKIDSFEQWAYSNPGHTHAEREAKWIELERRFNPGIDWTGLETEMGHLWTYKAHPFLQPQYYITYGYAQIGALQLFERYREDPVRAFAQFEDGLRLGFSRPLPELWSAIGIRYDFGEETLMRAVMSLVDELESLP